jgi:hypothetical protein
MQRPPYSNIPPAKLPPLHHPVPQHISAVPQLQSPPPPQTQSQPQQGQYGGYAQQGGQAGASAYPAFGGFINDSTAQMGFQVGRSAMTAGQEYMEENFNRYVNVSILKHYFNVSNRYVLSKLALILCPWRHRPWSRKKHVSPNGQEGFLPPREDINSPDMYIPLMAFVTYILLYTLITGLRGSFRPDLLGSISGTALVVVLSEIALLKFAMYVLAISSDSQLLDLVAYLGYKFVGVIVTLTVAEMWNRGGGTGGWVGWTVFAYTFLANAFFLLRSLRYVLLPDSSPNSSGGAASYTASRTQKSRCTQFLFGYSYMLQFFLMWFLSMSDRSVSRKR